MSRISDIPLVSICCLTYNHELFIRQCLDGFVMQKTNFAYEILIHDDASTDNTANIIREYEKKYPDIIKPIYQTENQYSKGIAVSKVYQFPRAKGKYIAICEGDDYWTDPLKLQKQVDFMEANPEYGLCYTDVDFFYQKTKEIKKSVFKNNLVYRTLSFEEHLIKRGYLAPCTWLFKKEFLDVIDSKKCVDGSFAMLLDFYKNTTIYFLDEVTSVYRVSEGSVSRSKDKRKEYFYEKGVFETQKDYILKYDVDKKTMNFVYSDAYFRLMKDAVLYEDQNFVDEAKTFFYDLGLNADSFILFCYKTIRTEQKLDIIRRSKWYKAGNSLLKPFFLFKDKLKK